MSNEKTKEEWKDASNEFSDKSAQARENFGKGEYISVSDDIEEFKSAYSAKEKAMSGGKIAGKSLFNMGKFTFGKAIPAVLNELSKKANERSK